MVFISNDMVFISNDMVFISKLLWALDHANY